MSKVLLKTLPVIKFATLLRSLSANGVKLAFSESFLDFFFFRENSLLSAKLFKAFPMAINVPPERVHFFNLSKVVVVNTLL